MCGYEEVLAVDPTDYDMVLTALPATELGPASLALCNGVGRSTTHAVGTRRTMRVSEGTELDLARRLGDRLRGVVHIDGDHLPQGDPTVVSTWAQVDAAVAAVKVAYGDDRHVGSALSMLSDLLTGRHATAYVELREKLAAVPSTRIVRE